MSKLTDINAKIAYLSRKVHGKGPKLKLKRPMYLKDQIRSGLKRSSTVSSQGCSQQMDAFLTCLDENNFLDANCATQFKALIDCDKSFQDLKKLRMTKFKEGEEVDGMVHPSIINQELKKYPNPINKDGINIQRNLLNTLPLLDRKPFPYKTKSQNSQKMNDNGLKVPNR